MTIWEQLSPAKQQLFSSPEPGFSSGGGPSALWGWLVGGEGPWFDPGCQGGGRAAW